jgi:hypothetical protein
MSRRSRSARLLLLLIAPLVVPAGCRRTRLHSSAGENPVVVMGRPGDGGPPSGEHEPNNTVATAQALTMSGDPLSATVLGLLGGSGKTADADVFKLVIPGLGVDASAVPDGGRPSEALAARRLVVEVHPEEEVAPVLQLLDAAGRPVLATSGGAGETEGLPNVAVAPGATYYLRLRAADRGARPPFDAGVKGLGYELGARVVDFEQGEEREPNDRAAQASELGPAASNPEAAGYFGWRKDEDWYRLPVDGLPPGSVVDLELDGVEGVSASLAVHDAAGTRLAGAHGRRSERVTLRNVAVAVASGGDAGVGRALYVVVRPESGRNLERRYGLHVRAGLAQEGTETEPNDDPAHASPAGDGLSTGFLGPGDVDVYRYTPAVPGPVDIDVVPPSGLNVKVEVLRRDGVEVLASADAAGRGQPEHLAAVPASEAVLVRLTVRRGEGNADEPYQLTIKPHAGPGR